MKKSLLSLFCAFAVMLSLVSPAAALNGQERYDTMNAVIEIIRRYGLESSADEDVLAEALIKIFEEDPEIYELVMQTILSSQDSHSAFIPAGQYETAFPVNEAYVGVGITIELVGEYVKIADINPNGPAAKTSLQVGDIITHVDITPVSGNMAVENISSLLRGKVDTTVSVTVRRGNASYSYTVTRAYIGIPNFTAEQLEEGIFYMDINRFMGDDTFIQFVFALQDLIRNKNKVLILDLRGNPGGELNMAFNMLNRLIPDIKNFFVVESRSTDGKKYEIMTSHGIGPRLNKIILLCDDGSASASEVMTSSLVDLGYAEAVGTTTYGKARGQSHLVMEDGSAAVLTTIRLTPPSGADYEEIGLKPAHEVKNAFVPHPASLLAPLTQTAAFGETSESAAALCAALEALGYLSKADNKGALDEAALAALNRLRQDKGMTAASGLDQSSLTAVNSLMASTKGQTVLVDYQLEKALELARVYAQQELQYTVDELGNFKNNPLPEAEVTVPVKNPQ